MNCLPFLGLENKVLEMGGFSMTIYDRSVRERACGLFERGLGHEAAAARLGIPLKAVRQWHLTYRAVGRDAPLDMGSRRTYDYETKAAAASAVADGGMAKPEAMARFGIASTSPLDSWCRLYREGGADALRPKPKGRPRGSGAKAAPATREEDLAQQREMLDGLAEAMPEGAGPVMQMDMGWQYQHADFVGALRGLGIVQSMSRKGNCLDNACTEGLFGHMKDEFFRGRDWDDFEEFKRDLEAYIRHWNNVRRQAKLKGLTPVEFREQALREAA